MHPLLLSSLFNTANWFDFELDLITKKASNCLNRELFLCFGFIPEFFAKFLLGVLLLRLHINTNSNKEMINLQNTKNIQDALKLNKL